MSEPGPNSKTKALEPTLGVIPGPPVDIGEAVSLDTLTPDQIRARLAARERDLKYHVQALRHEASTVLDDVNVGGRPLMDRIREKPTLAFSLAGGVGALVGVLLGLRARSKRRVDPPEDHIAFVQARLNDALDDAAHRVARGASVDQAMHKTMGTVPAVFGDAREHHAPTPSHKAALDVALQTAVGFGVKTVMDLLIQRFTTSDETFEALADAS